MVESYGSYSWDDSRQRPNLAKSHCSKNGIDFAANADDLESVGIFGRRYLELREERYGRPCGDEKAHGLAGAMADAWRPLTRGQRVVMARLLAAQDAAFAARGCVLDLAVSQ